jgi:hypothetical protein
LKAYCNKNQSWVNPRLFFFRNLYIFYNEVNTKQFGGDVEMKDTNNNIEGIETNEELANVMFDSIAEEQMAKVDELCGDNFDVMYGLWMEEEGLEFANEWAERNGWSLDTWEDIEEITKALMDNFIAYLES